MKKIFFLVLFCLTCVSFFAQSEEDLFGSEDDDLFSDDGIVEIQEIQPSDAVSADLSKGFLFQTGSVKIGGAFDLSLSTLTTFMPGKDAGQSFMETYLIPKADANLVVDARPTQNLRLYGKVGVHYPYITESTSALAVKPYDGNNFIVDTSPDFFAHLFYIKELFADFNLTQNVGVRFGKQTVSWGVGYFFSPADVINLTRINPENPSEQVEGPLALRAQIVFNGSQNAIWAYIIPDNNFAELGQSGVGTYLINTAFALKGDLVIKDWELGLGAWAKYLNPAKGMLTITGTLFRNYSVFGEAVLSIGRDNIPNDYQPVFQGTVGVMRSWSKPAVTVAAQYYFNGQEYSAAGNYGHNAALFAGFNSLFNSDLSAQFFAQYNFNSVSGTAFCTLKYTPIKEFSVSAGPYFIMAGNTVVTSVRLVFDLGSGKF